MRNLVRPSGLLGALLLAGCSFAPAYQPPTVAAIPASYKEAGPWQTAHPQDELPRGAWWRLYGDAELDRLETQVDTHNPTVAEAVANYDLARAAVAEAHSALLPQVGSFASMTTNRQSERRPTRSQTQPNQYPANTVGVQLDYDLDLWGRLRNTVAAQKAAAQASAADLATMRLSLHAEVAGDYMALRGLDAQGKLLAQTIAAYQRAVAITEARHTGKIASGIDVARAQDQLKATQAEASDIEAQRAVYEHALASLVGRPASSFAIAPSVVQIGVPQIPVGVPSTLLQRRPDIAAAERRVASANAMVGVARSAFYPDVSLSGLFGFQDTGEAALFSTPYTFWTLGPQMVMPVFEGGLRHAQVAAAQATLRASGDAYRTVVLTAFQQVEDSLSNLRILARALQQENEAVDAAQRAQRMAMSLYRDGATNFLDVVVAQTAALQAEQTALSLQTRALQASIDLVRALGGGWSTQDLPSGRVVAEVKPKW
ncbi:MAG TPA: efflux transporter outer membrane subunit [Rhodopila sp.]|nr:efflux transporter outer membrane subunit [Rhodopila sp.]